MAEEELSKMATRDGIIVTETRLQRGEATYVINSLIIFKCFTTRRRSEINCFSFYFQKSMPEILPVGIYTRRYVCFPHARPWLIHSYKNTKGRSTRLSQSNNQDSDANPSQDTIVLMEPKVEEEEDAPGTVTKHGEKASSGNPTSAPEQTLNPAKTKEQSSISIQDSSKNSEDSSQVLQPNSEHVATAEEQACESAEHVVSDQTSSTEALEKDDDTRSKSTKRPLDTPEQPTRSSKRRRTNRRDDTEESTGPPAISTYEKVRLICRPWRKPEGHLNRGVFSSMLEGVLLFIMASPSCPRKSVEDKFDPYLKPVATQELLEILEDLGCVIKIICRKRTQKPSLFSKPEVGSIVTEEKRNDEVLYETTQDCCLKFGQFSFFLSTLN
ncbi:hypothetical protein LOTGIDRAFT_228707 [Lottia gigantea]|uniref:Uncharacterized protein n=1 Tax=Lottia gigantea TaxID=225164 RepID=V4BQJ2_LOTGI|nr:hypothetical protein LOTGIDRAFT_228707 [Lottia gigantea]ESO91159.1 hypothetical protein LOTGIDRAFT_228707 [Lottia gigantea]